MNTEELARFGISMPRSLVEQFDALAHRKGFANRSQALADLVRNQIVENQGHEGSGEIAGTITLVYDHHVRNIQAQLTDVQHEHGNLIVATMHVHLDHHNCMEVLAVRGKARAVRKMADALLSTKGIKHGRLTVTTTGKHLPA